MGNHSGIPQALGIVVTRMTERASVHDGPHELELKDRLDVSRITLGRL